MQRYCLSILNQNVSDLGVEVRRIACYASASTTTSRDILVGLGGLEPPTSPLSGVRSNHLSYRPGFACLRTAWPRCNLHAVGHVRVYAPAIAQPAPCQPIRIRR